MNAQQPQNKTVTLLFNPFFYIAGVQTLILGLIAILLTGLVSSFGNTHFDGVLDTHVGAAAPLWVFFAEGLIDWICLADSVVDLRQNYFKNDVSHHRHFRHAGISALANNLYQHACASRSISSFWR